MSTEDPQQEKERIINSHRCGLHMSNVELKNFIIAVILCVVFVIYLSHK